MIESVHYKNLKALRDTTLPLGRFTLIVGPNGSGKSTALQALKAAGMSNPLADFNSVVSASIGEPAKATIEVKVVSGPPYQGVEMTWRWSGGGYPDTTLHYAGVGKLPEGTEGRISRDLAGIKIYTIDSRSTAAPAMLTPYPMLGEDGSNLPVIIDRLRDREPERFEALNAEVQRWLPEFDRVLFDTPHEGQRSLALRMRDSQRKVPATELSQGTLIALAILTLAYLPNPPAIMCFEEPDRGIHPRLLRDVRDALYRLSYPESSSEKREPVQVIATTHSPYLLDLFKDHPEEVVIADKLEQDVRFERLSDRDDLDEILGDAQLGDAWYSGVLGGVPSHP